MHSKVKEFPRSLKMASCFALVNNSSCATIRYVGLQSLNHNCQVAAFQKNQHLKISTLTSCPLPPPPPYALYEYINVDNCERPLIWEGSLVMQ